MPNENINNVFLTLQNCIIALMKVKGDNNHKRLHIMGNNKLARLSQLPKNLECP
jgi:hypothetical protein